MLEGKNGQVKGFVEFTNSPGALLTNPAMLAGAAGIMAQLAMQQTMDEITDYLAVIDKKVDDVLRAQQDAVLAEMIGVDFVVEEAMTIRAEVGRVSEVTWSKVQATTLSIARTQGYALQQLDALAEKLESETRIGDIDDAAEEAQKKVQEWLAVLARCFQLQDAIAILELDRVLDTSPDELDKHRRGLRTGRDNRLERIAESTKRLLSRMDVAAGTANTKVLLHPATSRDVVHATNHVAVEVADFHERLGIASGQESWEARRWVDAATDAKDRAFESGVGGVHAARAFGNETFGRAKSMTGKLSGGLPKASLHRRRASDDD